MENANHLALYRKWRPRTFDEVCGQEHITEVLKYETGNGQLSHAYLFCGSRGTGKTSCAKILAKAVNCLSPRGGNPCGECAACRAIDSGTTTDVLEMDAASNNGVDSIRDIRDEVNFAPADLKYRVYIIDEVHMLSLSAFNALLKTLEEPPAHVIFILATTELQKLPSTIISRCQRFDFRRITVDVIMKQLKYVAGQESIALDDEAAHLIARLAQGGMRDAISLLELCSGGGVAVTPDRVNEAVGSVGRGAVIATAVAVAEADYDRIFGIIAESVASSKDLSVFWQELLSLYRDMMVVKTTPDAQRYLDLTDSETSQLKEVADMFSRERLLAHCRLLDEAFPTIQHSSAVKRTVAEMTLIKMSDPTLDTSAEALLARIARLEDAIRSGAAASFGSERPTSASVPADASRTAEQSTVEKQKKPTPTVEDGAEKPEKQETPAPAVRKDKPAVSAEVKSTRKALRSWVEVVDRVSKQKAPLAGLLAGSRAYTEGDGRVIIRMRDAFGIGQLDIFGGRQSICEALCAELGTVVRESDLVVEVKPTADDTPDDDIFDEIEKLNEQ